MIARYAKLVVSLVGLAVMLASEFFGITAFIGMEDTISNGIIMALTAFGVWAIPNDPPVV